MKGLFNAASSGTGKTAAGGLTDDTTAPSDEATFINGILLQGHTYTTLQRRKAVQRLIAYLKEHTASSTSDAEHVNAVTALKTLGRSADDSEDLASEEGINLLLELAQFTPASSSSDEAFLRDPLPPASSEAIRCLANVCLLHETGRVRLAGVNGLPEALMKSGEQATDPTTRFLAARLLFLTTISGTNTLTIKLVEQLQIARYISTRLLEDLELLAASKELNIVNPADPGLKMKIDTLIEYLKVAFNVSLFYPRAVQERRETKTTAIKQEESEISKSSKGKGKVEASNMSKSLSSSSTTSTSTSASSTKQRSRSSSPTELFASLTSKNSKTTPSTSPSTKQETNLNSSAMSPSSSSTSNTSNGRSKSPSSYPKMATDKIKGYFSSSSSTSTASRKGKEGENGVKEAKNGSEDVDVLKAWGFEDVVSALVQLALCLPFGTGPDFGPFGAYKHLINALLNYNFTAYSDVIYAPLSPFLACPIGALPSTSPTRPEPSLPPLVARLLTLLDGSLAYYIPGTSGPDDDEAREATLSAPGVLDEALQVLILLLAKLAIEDASGEVRRGFKLCLLADDIDRTVGLEKRADLTGRLIRLLNSAYLSGSAEATGKFLFSICDQDPSNLVTAIGYGNASGFLQSMNMLIPPGATAGNSASDSNGNSSSSSNYGNGSSSSTSRPINPITGAYEPASPSNEPSMTDEEKEHEAEKLFVLFDRMNRNGAMSVVNPVKQAQESGKLQSTTEEEEMERKKLQEEEEEDERQALAELQRYKERKNRLT